MWLSTGVRVACVCVFRRKGWTENSRISRLLVRAVVLTCDYLLTCHYLLPLFWRACVSWRGAQKIVTWISLVSALTLTCDYLLTCHYPCLLTCHYGVATISRLLKFKGLFCRNSLFTRALLQKRPMILRSLLIVVTPYVRPLLTSDSVLPLVWLACVSWEGRDKLRIVAAHAC